MPTPQLWLETPALSEAVHSFADTKNLTADERHAALVIFGWIIGEERETSPVKALRKVGEAIELGSEHLIKTAAEYQRRGATTTYGVIGPKSAPAQEEIRWDTRE